MQESAQVEEPDPWEEQGASYAASPSDDLSGTYVDHRGKVQGFFTFSGNMVHATFPPDTGWTPESGSFHGDVIEIFKMRGQVSNGQIKWEKNNSVWTRQAGPAEDGRNQAWEGRSGRAEWRQLPAGQSQSRRDNADGRWRTPAGEAGGGAAAATAAAAAADAWTKPQATGWGQPVDKAAEDDAWRQQQNQKLRDVFKTYQDWYVQQGTLPGPSKNNDEEALFSQEALGAGVGIDFDLYDQVPCDITGPNSENMPSLRSFDELYTEFHTYIPEQLMANIQRCGYSRPTPVQRFAMPAGLVGRDIMCCAQTGSGKTVAFLVPTLANMIAHDRGVATLQEPYRDFCKPNTLILSPTRELCLQIYDEALKLCHSTSFRCSRVYGKEPSKVQIEDISRGADLIVATPGRLWEFVDAGVVNVEDTCCLVLDEADRMLSMGMEAHIRGIVEDNKMPRKEDRQTLMFSATFPEECQRMAADYLFEYLWVGVGVIGGAVNTVSQVFEKVAPEDKFERLLEMLNDFLDHREESNRLLVFTNSKMQAKGLDEKLWNENIDTGSLHGDLQQHEREENLKKFRKGEIDVMVATDLASRGLDIHGVSHVINYDLPHGESAKDVYVQRIGRTGRIGHRGVATTFLAVDKDGNWLDDQYLLAELPRIISDSGQQLVPDWLADKAQELELRNTSWADKKKWKTEDKGDWSGSWKQRDTREDRGTNGGLKALEQNFSEWAPQQTVAGGSAEPAGDWGTYTQAAADASAGHGASWHQEDGARAGRWSANEWQQVGREGKGPAADGSWQ